jgi:hypothetical protein
MESKYGGLIVNGHAKHGKDYLADKLAAEFKLKKLNASMWFAETVMMRAFPEQWSCVEDCYLDRVNHRALWYQMMRIGDWQERIMQHSQVFCGHRNIMEHQRMFHRKQGNKPYLRVFVHWLGAEIEGPESCEWQDVEVIRANHDLELVHTGDGAEKMMYRVKEMWYA